MGKEGPPEAGKGGTFGIINSKKATDSQSWIPETLLCQLLHLLPSPGTLIMKGFLLLILSALLCWVSGEHWGTPRDFYTFPHPLCSIAHCLGSQVPLAPTSAALL